MQMKYHPSKPNNLVAAKVIFYIIIKHEAISFLQCHFQSSWLGGIQCRNRHCVRYLPQQSAPVVVYSQEAVCALLTLASEGFQIARHYSFAVGNFRQDCRYSGLSLRKNCCFLCCKDVESPFFGAFAKLRKVTISFIMSVRLSAWNNSAPTGRILIKIYI